MCSNTDRNGTTFKNELASKTNSNFYYKKNNSQPTPSANNPSGSTKQAEHTYYAKLVSVNQQNQQRRMNNCIRNSTTNAYTNTTRRLTDNYLNAKLAEYLNEADYEVLRNFDSVLETVPVPKVDQLNYSNEEEDFQKYYELGKFHSSLQKNIQKCTATTSPQQMIKSTIANTKRLDSTSVGSFSSSSASSISSQSSITNSSQTSSSSSSPLLSANFLTDPNIYSTNYKVRNHRTNTNNAVATRIASPVPTPPSSQIPSLTPLKLIKSQSATITKTSMSAWIHPPVQETLMGSESSSYDELNCEYSDLTDSVPVKLQVEPIVPVLKKSNHSVSKLNQQSTGLCCKFDSTLLTPLKPIKSTNNVSDSSPPTRSNSTANIKSASTSYLLSKITSITSHNNNQQPKPINTNNSPSPSNPLTSLAKQTSRFFQSRKSLNQINSQLCGAEDLISSASSSSNSISHSHITTTTTNSSSPISSPNLGSATSSSVSVASSRRAYIKKRSQSTHASINKQAWVYNGQLDLWTLLNNINDSGNGKPDFISSTLRLTKRKSNTNKISAQLGLSPMCSGIGSNSELGPVLGKVRLNKIELKYLTQVELVYLKKICFDKLKTQLEQVTLEMSSKSRKQSFGGSVVNVTRHQELLHAIPKDESLKLTKTKNIAPRSKSVDFKFFDDLKENYFSKKTGTNGQQQVFGQSLYKCILNDLQRVPKPTENSNSTGTITKRWRSNTSKQQSVLIASRGVKDDGNCEAFNKRNSVLFEALDLKNVKNSQKNGCQTTPVLGGHKPRLSSSRNRLTPINDSTEVKASESLNQNLSIRSEGLVPNIVKSCCKHITEHGLDLVGIFRIDSSKKRIKEIREMYDSGKEVVLDDQFNPNDSACVLKEYLRSLPDSLLTRDLYSSFLTASKIKDTDKKLETIRFLICLLPVPNRDTLQMILSLLNKVRANSSIQTTPEKPTATPDPGAYSGNKMDSFNLAMVFGPNLLKKHCGSGGHQSMSARGLSSGKLNECDKFNLIDDIDSVISVTKFLIENQSDIFHIESSLHNDLIDTINKADTSQVNSLLTRKQISLLGLTILPTTTDHPTENEYFNLNTTSSDTTPTQSDHNSPNSISSCSSNQLQTPPEICQNSKFLNYLNADFIDNQKTFTRAKNSRTKLTKIVDNFNYLNCADTARPIHFVNSPTHSPINNSKSSTTKKSSVRQLKKYSNDSSNTKSSSNTTSPLLLMLQPSSVNNENRATKKSAKSMSNLTQITSNDTCTSPVLVVDSGVNSMRRQSSSNGKNNMIQYSNKVNVISQMCPKFYEKTKYNIIGEQETLV